MNRFALLILFFGFSSWMRADENVVKQVLEPQPIIAIDDVKSPMGASSSSMPTTSEPVVDTEAASPIAPQSFDGYDGVTQEVFAPTAVEKQAMLKRKQDEEQKERELAARIEAAKIKASQPAPARKKAQPLAKRVLAKAGAKKSTKSPARKVASVPKPAAKLQGRRKSATVTK